MTKDTARSEKFFALVQEAKACLLCPRMSSSVRVIGPASGSIHSPILIIGEAPGRLGADSSAIPFHGDKAGDNFEALLEQVGLSRHVCFITNAALCNPKDEKGNNSTPTRHEINNCSDFLKRQIDIVSPKIVVTLGAQALHSLSLIEPHQVTLSEGVRKKFEWNGRILVPLYHPGQRAMIHRSFFNQLADYKFLAEIFSRTEKKGAQKISTTPTSALVKEIVRNLLRETGPISYFALHKLFYLTEYEYFRQNQRRMTSSYIIRQKDGPYVVELHIKKLRKAIADLEITTHKDQLILNSTDEASLFDNDRDTLSPDIKNALTYVARKYHAAKDTDLKRAVYLTSPMREILRQEKNSRQNFFNTPIDFSLTKPAF